MYLGGCALMVGLGLFAFVIIPDLMDEFEYDESFLTPTRIIFWIVTLGLILGGAWLIDINESQKEQNVQVIMEEE